MSSRRIFQSASNAQSSAAAAQWLKAQSAAEALVLAPTHAAADEFARQAAEAGVLGLHRMTLLQLASELSLARAADHNLVPLSALGRQALAARVTHLAQRGGQLAYFKPVAAQPGFARALATTIEELRMQDVPPADLAQAGAPGADLTVLAALYAQELAARSLADACTLFRLASETAQSSRHRFAGLPLVLLDVPLDTEAQRALVAALASRSTAVAATVHSNDERGAGWLEEIVGARCEPLDADPGGSTLQRLRRQLFSSHVIPAQDGDGTLEFFSAPGEGLECVEIARRMLRFASEGVAFDRMAILLRGSERYQSLVEEALRRAGIPAYFSRGSARPDPAGRAFLALLACAAEGCTASRFAEYLSLGQVPSIPSETAWVQPEDESLGAITNPEPEQPQEPAPPRTGFPHFAWEKLLVDAAVVGGRDRWQRRLKGLENEFQLKLAELKEEDRSHLERRLEQLRTLEQFALPLIDTLASLPSRAAWGEWLDRLADLARMALRAPDSVLAILAELEPMSEVGPVDLDEVSAVLSERLRFLRREPPPRRYGRVFVGTIEEARARSFDVVFLPGLAEGLFPRRAFEDPLLLDEHRRKLARGLLLQDDRVARERMLLHTATAAATRLVVSYPRMDAVQARPRVPSFYAMEVVRAAEGRLPDLRAFEHRAAAAAPALLAWPAPRNAPEAIDDAEYDLAWLGPLVALKPQEARGKGRYVILVNPHLARALRTRSRRWRNFFSAADGIVEPDAATAAVLAKHRLSARPYSPSGLQHYAACPYRFVLHSIHGLRPREEPVALEEMDPLTRGSLFHAVQFAFFRELESAGPLTLEAIFDLGDKVLNRVAAAYADQLAPAIPRVWSAEVEDLRMDLRGWIRHLVASLSEWKPLRYELSFGLPLDARHDPDSTPEEVVILDGVRLRGSMDIVERNETRGVLRVTDHKTGRPPEAIPKYVGGGALLQPLLYALAAERLLGQPVAAGRLFYCTQRGGYTPIDIAVTDQSRAFAQKVMGTIDGAIAGGFLPAVPQAHACETCDYTSVCGPYEQQRLRGKKRDDRLEPLLELRNTP